MRTDFTQSLDLLRLVHDWYRPLRDKALACRTPDVLCEHSETRRDCQFGERFLQILWNEQRLSPPLTTPSGRPLEVVSPGTWNVGAGPDFRRAVIRLGGHVRRGDVEVHRDAADWYRHGHDQDPEYADVVLHAVWTLTRGSDGPDIPCLDLSSCVDRPLRDLMSDLEAAVYPYARKVAPGSCAVRWALTDDESVQRVLRAAGLARFEDKTVRLQRAMIAEGAHQALYEGVFEALGYKENRDSFRALAHAVPLSRLRELGDPASWEACLFGAAGLLPDPSVNRVLSERHTDVRALWDRWWETGGDCLNLTWKRGGSRPLNSPERRLAAGVCWLVECDLSPRDWLLAHTEDDTDPEDLPKRLRQGLAISSPWEPYQNWARKLTRRAALLGTSRIDDLIVNSLLPFLNALGQARGDESLSTLARESYLAMPTLQNNRHLTEAVHRFLVPPSRVRTLVSRACDQQGLLELYRCFCMVLDGDCANCPFTLAGSFEDFTSRK